MTAPNVTELVPHRPVSIAPAIEQVLIRGDLAGLSSDQRIEYHNRVCDTVGLNPLTMPFAYITMNGKLVLYALKSCAEQLRKIHGISVTITARAHEGGVYMVTAQAKELATGRVDEAIGAVAIDNLKGEALCNALMKTETKAKRRVTLSICGLGMLDESEVEDLPPDVTAPPPATVTAQADAMGGVVARGDIEDEVARRATKGDLDKLAKRFFWLSVENPSEWLADRYQGITNPEHLSREQVEQAIKELDREVDAAMPPDPATGAQTKRFHAGARKLFPAPKYAQQNVYETAVRDWLMGMFQVNTTKFLSESTMSQVITALENGELPGGTMTPPGDPLTDVSPDAASPCDEKRWTLLKSALDAKGFKTPAEQMLWLRDKAGYAVLRREDLHLGDARNMLKILVGGHPLA